ncbi:DUF6541 family protein [Arsenicicoccus bolidensis]|uniref:DUF6541 family protein n=1 Tax=Arsenicicoccus bolidensis TaxID=229480 RepID=UPI00041C2586|nr:DUF6541 family protein [Arsenicicoccus bolidensis]
MTWFPFLSSVVTAGLVLTVPGLIAGLAAGLRRDALWGLAPLLSLTAVALGVLLHTRLALAWGLVPVLVGTLVLTALGAVVGLAPRVLDRRRRREGGATRVNRASRWRRLLPTGAYTIAVIATSAWMAAITVHAIGDVSSMPQNLDAVFHLNAIERVAEHRDASPTMVSSTAVSTTPVPFYPPLFHAIGSLLVLLTGATPFVAANVLALVIAAVAWPVSVLFLTSAVLGSRIQVLIPAGLAAATLAVFPYLPLSFGVLWPNSLGLAVVPAVVALVAVVLGLVRVPGVGRGRATVLGLVSAIGLAYAHPGSVFSVMAFAVPMGTAALAKLVLQSWPQGGGRRWGSLALVAVVAGAVKWFWPGILDDPLLKPVRSFDWPATRTLEQAFGEAIALSTEFSPAAWLVGGLVLAGAGLSLRRRQGRWLVVTHAALVYLYVQAAGSDDQLSSDLTMFWYNDRFRLAAMLAITAVPLAALALVEAFDRLRAGGCRLVRGRRVSASLPRWGALGVTVAALVSLTPGNLSPFGPYITLAKSYRPASPEEILLDPAEQRLYAENLVRNGPQDAAKVVGNPWNGASLAGAASGREPVFGHLVTTLDADRTLLKERFNQLDSDPAVCAAVRRLNVGYATEDKDYFQPWDRRTRTYPGLMDLQNVRGLTRVAHEDSVAIYRVTGCGRG